MKRVLVQKGIGVALIASGVILLILKVMSIPDAIESANAWAYPDDGTLWLAGFLVIEFILLTSRFTLGAIFFLSKPAGPWSFYLLVLLTAVSGISGTILVFPALIFRLWRGDPDVVKT